MSDGRHLSAFSNIFAAYSLLLVACHTPSASDEVDVTETALGEATTITFQEDFRVALDGALQAGKSVRVNYDTDRLTACRGELNGGPGWSITGYWRIDGGPIRSFEAGGFSPSHGTSEPVLPLDRSGDLEMWFENTSRWGCRAFDSDFGQNFHFTVLPRQNEPGWMGNVQSIIERRTCNGPCEVDMRPVRGDILYDTWARQRAAIRAMFFEVWKAGVTDFDNVDLWKQLDVQIHSRHSGSDLWTTSYVSLDRRVGNNARYTVDLRTLDSLDPHFTITNPADCPAFPLTVTQDGSYVETTVELYFTVNGAELRPASGDVFRIRYQNYRGLYAPCIP